MTDDKQVSKLLSYWLRHKPDDAGIVVDPSGWALFDDVLAALTERGVVSVRTEIERVIAESDKNRFEISPDGSQIRARQGHSIKVDLDWPIALPPARLYHGTVERFLDAIMREGLRPMARHHVHLSPDVETASSVGQRRGKPLILAVAAGDMAASGTEFRLSGNGVWLVEAVPPQFLTRV